MNGQYLVKTKPQLEQFVTENLNAINRYIDKQQSQIPMPIYSSVDIRESKDKFAPVDNNLYPAGFNNICKLDLDACESDFAHIINEIAPGITAVGILPEAHTKNTFYLDHLPRPDRIRGNVNLFIINSEQTVVYELSGLRS